MLRFWSFITKLTYLLSLFLITYNILPQLTNTVLNRCHAVVSISRGLTTQDHLFSGKDKSRQKKTKIYFSGHYFLHGYVVRSLARYSTCNCVRHHMYAGAQTAPNYQGTN